MANFRVLAGQHFNLLERANAITPSSVNTLFPVSYAYDTACSLYFKYLTSPPETGANIIVDGRLIPGGNMETWSGGVPVGGTDLSGVSVVVAITGTVVQDNTIQHSGTSSAKVTGTTGVLTLDKQVRAGEFLNLDCWLRGDATTGVARIRLQNLQTGNYLQAGGASWAAGVSDLATQSAASFAELAAGGLPFQMESYLTCLSDLVWVRIYCLCTTAGNAWFDDLSLTTAVDTGAVIAHNIEPGVGASIESDPAGTFSGGQTVQASPTVKQPGFYSVLGSRQYVPYWRVRFPGANSTYSGPISLGEVFLGQSTILLKNPNFNHDVKYLDPDVEGQSRSGEEWVYSLSTQRRRTYLLSWNLHTDQYQQMRDELYKRSRGRRYPLLVIPDDTDTETVLHCRLTTNWDFKRSFLNFFDAQSLSFMESPYPSPNQ